LMNFRELTIELNSLTIFRALREDPVLHALSDCLSMAENDPLHAIGLYCDFVHALYQAGSVSLSGYLQKIVSDDENVYIRTVGRGIAPDPILRTALDGELAILQKAADLTGEDFRELLQYTGYLPGYAAEKIDLAAGYHHRCEHIGRYGYGIYSRYHMFYLEEGGHIVPVKNPDSTRLSQLIDYKREQQTILDNTLALLAGKPAANILLTGDAGTGKSSTIKAVVNELHDRGLRILEIRKEQLRKIPAIIDELNANPLKFILFIDDLSFVKDDDNFSALKAILEGSVSAKAGNIVIYATSNRRHLVKEKFSDREGDDVHVSDTTQELISLSERFGIHITFNRPDKKTYLDIVHHLAEEEGIVLPEAELDAAAERYALGRGNRSARAARQFVDGLLSQIDKI